MRCGWAKRTSSPIAGPGRVHAPVSPTIKGPNRPTCSVRSAPNAEPAPLSCCRPATPKLCSFTSMRSHQDRSGRSRYCPPRSSRMAWRQGPQGSKQHLALAASATRTRTQRPRKYLAIHAAELVVEPSFQILRRYRRPLLLRLEHTHRPALEDHVYRATRLGSSRSLKLRIGITHGWCLTGSFEIRWVPHHRTHHDLSDVRYEGLSCMPPPGVPTDGASTLFIGRPRSALRAFVTGPWLPPCCIPRVRQHVSCVTVRRDAILGHPCNTADLRGAPAVGALGLECWSDRPSPMKTSCRSRGET